MTNTNSSNNKRIVKNTFLLYFRMLLTMGVSLYTSRVILNTLGVEDFGVYNVVGGVVMMFAFLNSTMSSATQRFISYEIGKKDYVQLKRVFSMSFNIHVIISIVIFLFAETVGLWFLKNKLVIPLERMEAATWVFHFSVLSFMFTVLSVPYNATIIAFERMNAFAYLSIVEVTLKLIVVFILVYIDYDKLKMYSILIFGVSLIVFLLYRAYCKFTFAKARYIYFWDRNLYGTLMSYAGWNLFGNVAGVAMGQGINILLNLFFGPIVNAARGVAYQINGAINAFVSNFQVALNPQIVKSYATENYSYMHQLIFQGAKYSYFVMYALALPILLEADIVLHWWLKTVPEYTATFSRLILIITLIDCVSGPLMTAAQASGKIKKYQSVVGGLLLLILPISYFLLELGAKPQVTLYVNIVVSISALFFRLWMLKPLIHISSIKFFREVIVVILFVSIISMVFPIVIRINMEQGPFRFIIVSLTSIICTLITIYTIGFGTAEKDFVKSRLSAILGRFS